MTLVNCKECGHEVSDQAKSCPNCGAKVNQKNVFGMILVYGFIALIAYVAIDEAIFYYNRATGNTESGRQLKELQELNRRAK